MDINFELTSLTKSLIQYICSSDSCEELKEEVCMWPDNASVSNNLSQIRYITKELKQKNIPHSIRDKETVHKLALALKAYLNAHVIFTRNQQFVTKSPTSTVDNPVGTLEVDISEEFVFKFEIEKCTQNDKDTEIVMCAIETLEEESCGRKRKNEKDNNDTGGKRIRRKSEGEIASFETVSASTSFETVSANKEDVEMDRRESANNIDDNKMSGNLAADLSASSSSESDEDSDEETDSGENIDKETDKTTNNDNKERADEEPMNDKEEIERIFINKPTRISKIKSKTEKEQRKLLQQKASSSEEHEKVYEASKRNFRKNYEEAINSIRKTQTLSIEDQRSLHRRKEQNELEVKYTSALNQMCSTFTTREKMGHPVKQNLDILSKTINSLITAHQKGENCRRTLEEDQASQQLIHDRVQDILYGEDGCTMACPQCCRPHLGKKLDAFVKKDKVRVDEMKRAKKEKRKRQREKARK